MNYSDQEAYKRPWPHETENCNREYTAKSYPRFKR